MCVHQYRGAGRGDTEDGMPVHRRSTRERGAPAGLPGSLRRSFRDASKVFPGCIGERREVGAGCSRGTRGGSRASGNGTERGPKTWFGLRVWCPWDCWCYCILRCHGRVAEWQTRWLQVPVSFGTWGFKSPFAHHERFYELQGRRLRTRKGFVTSGFFLSEGVLVVGRRVLGLTNSSPANCRATHLAVAASEQSTRHNGAD